MSQAVNVILHGDCRDVLKNYPDGFFDAVVTDLPYGLSKEPDIFEVVEAWMQDKDITKKQGGFMGKEWASLVPDPAPWKKIFRVLKPGRGFLLTFAGTRIYDLMGLSLRLAGFRLLGSIHWVYASGFPKSLNLSRAIDQALGAEPIVVEELHFKSGGFASVMKKNLEQGYLPVDYYEVQGNIIKITEPATPQARRWEGWGTSLQTRSRTYSHCKETQHHVRMYRGNTPGPRFIPFLFICV